MFRLFFKKINRIGSCNLPPSTTIDSAIGRTVVANKAAIFHSLQTILLHSFAIGELSLSFLSMRTYLSKSINPSANATPYSVTQWIYSNICNNWYRYRYFVWNERYCSDEKLHACFASERASAKGAGGEWFIFVSCSSFDCQHESQSQSQSQSPLQLLQQSDCPLKAACASWLVKLQQ